MKVKYSMCLSLDTFIHILNSTSMKNCPFKNNYFNWCYIKKELQKDNASCLLTKEK